MFSIFDIVKAAKKNITKTDIVIGILLIVLYFATRVIYLSNFPIFSDEGIYIHWAKIAWHDANWRFISLTDGRQPLQTWATIPLLKLFGPNMLFAGRMFGVLSGFFGLVGIYLTSLRLFNKKAALVAAFLFIITPFYVFFDRLAMIDSLVNAACIWIFYFSLVVVQTLRLDGALLMGFFSGIFLLAKSNASMFIALSVFATIADFKKKLDFKRVVNYLILYVLAAGMAFLIYNIQRLSPFLHFVGVKNTTFVLTISEFLHNPFQVFWNNLPLIPLYTAHNLGWMTFILGLIGYYFIFKQNKGLALYIGLWIMLPYIFMSFFMRVLYSRYHIFLLAFFIMLASYAIVQLWEKIKNKKIYLAVLFVGYLFTFYFSYTVMFKYADIPFLDTDRGQYIEGWPSGWGMNESVSFLKNQATHGHVIILAEGNFGMSGDVLDTLIKDSDNISIKGYWPLSQKELEENQSLLSTNKIYALYAHEENIKPEYPLKLIQRFSKPHNKSAIYLFELTR